MFCIFGGQCWWCLEVPLLEFIFLFVFVGHGWYLEVSLLVQEQVLWFHIPDQMRLMWTFNLFHGWNYHELLYPDQVMNIKFQSVNLYVFFYWLKSSTLLPVDDGQWVKVLKGRYDFGSIEERSGVRELTRTKTKRLWWWQWWSPALIMGINMIMLIIKWKY